MIHDCLIVGWLHAFNNLRRIGAASLTANDNGNFHLFSPRFSPLNYGRGTGSLIPLIQMGGHHMGSVHMIPPGCWEVRGPDASLRFRCILIPRILM